MVKDSKNMLQSEAQQLQKLQEIVKRTIADEDLILEHLLHPPQEVLTKGQRFSDKIAAFGGSWGFIISFFVLLLLWIAFNVWMPMRAHFDPYPFILMNLILSCVAALQAPVIMMSQNRQEEKDRKRSENDYMVNLKSELEIKALHEKIDLLLQEQIKVLIVSQAKQMDVLLRIEKELKKG